MGKKIRIRKGSLVGFAGCLSIVYFFTILLILSQKSDLDKKNKIFEEIVRSKQGFTKVGDLKADFLHKCLIARQVYQWSWYKKVKTKLGYVKLDRRYAMNLREYNELVEMSWKLNRHLSIPLDHWQNYIMLAKWILESSLNANANHKTGEIIKFAGYTKSGLQASLTHYLFESDIRRGHPLYISELFKKGITLKNIIRSLEKFDHVIKYDYAYILFLLSEYGYRWDWTLTAFHFGEHRTDYWRKVGLKTIPNYRLDGKWKDHYLRQYYQTVYEIAKGIYLGKFTRISRFQKKVKKLRKQREIHKKFYATLRLKIKSKEDFLELENRLKEVQQEYEKFKKDQIKLIEQMGELNDLVLDYRKSKKKKLKDWAKRLYRKIIPLKKSIKSNYKKLKK